MDTTVLSNLWRCFATLSVFGLILPVCSCNKQETSLMCETGEATEVTENAATLSGRAVLLSELTGTVSLGFLLSTQDNPSLDNSNDFRTNVIDQFGLFKKEIRGINSNTKYYYRAFVKWNDIYVFGTVNSFETKKEVYYSVYASGDLFYSNGEQIHVDPVLYEGFRRDHFTDNDLEAIFVELIQHASPDFKTAILYLEIHDKTNGKHLRDEQYSVYYNSQTGHYDFTNSK